VAYDGYLLMSPYSHLLIVLLSFVPPAGALSFVPPAGALPRDGRDGLPGRDGRGGVPGRQGPPGPQGIESLINTRTLKKRCALVARTEVMQADTRTVG